MFESVTFRNLQKHRKITVEFDQGVTTLVGSSQAGKTALIRGLGLICLNQWNKAYLRHGKDTVIGTLKVDGQTIKRKKGKRVNQYLINGKVLKRDLSSGNNLPEDIAVLLNIGPENFQKQLDPHFWFLDTPGQVSKNLNSIVNLSAIDSTLSAAVSEVKIAKATVEVSQNRYLAARNELHELRWIREFEQDLQELERREEGASAIRSRIASIRFCIANVSRLDSHRNIAFNAMLDAKNLLALARKVRELSRRRFLLQKITKELRLAEELVKQGCPDLTELNGIRKAADQKAEDRRELEMLIQELKQAGEKSCRLIQQVHTETAKLEKLSKNNRCPVCGTILTSKKRLKQSSSPTYTCDTKHRYHDERKAKIGTESWQGI